MFSPPLILLLLCKTLEPFSCAPGSLISPPHGSRRHATFFFVPQRLTGIREILSPCSSSHPAGFLPVLVPLFKSVLFVLKRACVSVSPVRVHSQIASLLECLLMACQYTTIPVKSHYPEVSHKVSTVTRCVIAGCEDNSRSALLNQSVCENATSHSAHACLRSGSYNDFRTKWILQSAQTFGNVNIGWSVHQS